MHLKRIGIFWAGIFSLASLGLMTGCGEKVAVSSVALEYRAGNTYMIGETVCEPNNKLKITYSDGSEERIPISGSDIAVTGDTSSVGEKTGTVTYGALSTTFRYTVYEEIPDTVSVDGGEISGYYSSDGAVEIYKGIPYAAPPVGENRWHAPKDVEPWSGVKKCVHFGPNAMQSEAQSSDYMVDNWAGYSEDCLTLNVWTSGRDTAEKPVLVFIHGGGYITGGSSCPIYDGTNMARQDVVFVSINYRLGAFGFLATEELKEEDDGCGNFGLLDQIKALEWVQENIAAFGGDRDNVTIMGQSAGGGSVETLLASPMTEGLFANAAIISAGWIHKDPSTVDEKIAGVDTKGRNLAELRALPAEEIATAISKAGTGGCIDGKLLSMPVRDSLALGTNSNVNVLSGTLPGDPQGFGIEDGAVATAVQNMLGLRNYFVNARQKGGATGSNYIYYYDYIQTGTKYCNHTDDVTFWFGNTTTYYSDTWSETDARMAQIASAYLVNFCKSGNPNGGNLTEWLPSDGKYTYFHLYLECENTALPEEVVLDIEETYSYLNYLLER